MQQIAMKTPQVLGLILLITTLDSIKIPLTNLTDSRSNKTYPVHIDFNSRHTTYPHRAHSLILEGLTVPMSLITNYSSQFVKIGLGFPSDFLIAVSKVLKAQESDIEFTYQNQNQLQMLVSEVNLVERKELFPKVQRMDYIIVYNYGNPLRINQQTTKIVDGSKIFFNEFFILQVLNSMAIDNRIGYTRNGSTIKVHGNTQNFPHIITWWGENQVRFHLNDQSTLYINNVSSANLVGIQCLKDYSKFQIVEGGILLKRSSLSIVLYIFLGMYSLMVMGMIIGCWKQSQFVMGFIRNILKAVFLKDDRARVQLLMTELE